jgi:lactate permease
MDVILCLSPILLLLAMTLKKDPLPTTLSLPFAALIMGLIRLMYLGSDPLLVCAAIVSGLHEALSPLSIMFGAILLFETMEATLCMPYMMREMKAMTQGHPVAELMLTFAFAYMVEGASGFGTPVALCAPMLVSLGYDKMAAVVTLLLMNTFATVWGAAGELLA